MMAIVDELVQGHCDTRFEKVANALAEEIESGEELGAAIAVDIDGTVDGRTSRFIGDRDEVRRRATQSALNMIRVRTFQANQP